MEKEEAQNLLKRYRLGQCTERELALINNWYNSFDETETDLLAEDKLKEIKKQMFEGITEKIVEREERESRRKKYGKPTKKLYFSNFKYVKRVAALLLIGMTFAFFYFNRNKEMPVKENTIASNKLTKETLPSIIYLSDGSKVTLKEGSRLEYPASFTGNTREVTLVGEAFFEVAKNAEKPFIIHAANITTKVLGTSFNIKAYEHDVAAEVSVVTGKVSVSVNSKSRRKRKEVVLVPNQKAIYSKEKDALVQMEMDKKEFVQSDKKARLVFNETPLGEIVKVMSAYYKIPIRLEHEGMKNCLITAELTDEPIEVSLMILTKAIGAEYEVKEGEILLKGKGCVLSK